MYLSFDELMILMKNKINKELSIVIIGEERIGMSVVGLRRWPK
jgi:hypothetical protein